MFGSYWYIEGGDGRHYCYAKELSVECPIGSMERLGDTLTIAAEEVGIDPAFMLRKLQHSAQRRRDDGKLTMLCSGCGHKLTSLGFRYWIEGDPPREGTAMIGRAVSLALGGSGFVMVEGPWYATTKKDAQAWAHMRAKQTKEDNDGS
jgi:hypothetical protein